MIGAAVYWFVIAPRKRPDLLPGEVYGIDVSNHQKDIDWGKVAEDDIAAVYMKSTEGQGFVDKRFAENWAGSAKAGIRRGAYHFFTLCAPGAAQADNFLRVVPLDPEALPPAVDLEFSNCPERPDKAGVLRELTTFVDKVESATGKKVVIYAISSFTEAYPLPDTLVRERWVRSLWDRPDENNWKIWQASARSRIHGIGEPTDLNVWKLPL
jgi:lysozyme